MWVRKSSSLKSNSFLNWATESTSMTPGQFGNIAGAKQGGKRQFVTPMRRYQQSHHACTTSSLKIPNSLARKLSRSSLSVLKVLSNEGFTILSFHDVNI
jgi:hypothetical protein